MLNDILKRGDPRCYRNCATNPAIVYLQCQPIDCLLMESTCYRDLYFEHVLKLQLTSKQFFFCPNGTARIIGKGFIHFICDQWCSINGKTHKQTNLETEYAMSDYGVSDKFRPGKHWRQVSAASNFRSRAASWRSFGHWIESSEHFFKTGRDPLGRWTQPGHLCGANTPSWA